MRLTVGHEVRQKVSAGREDDVNFRAGSLVHLRHIAALRRLLSSDVKRRMPLLSALAIRAREASMDEHGGNFVTNGLPMDSPRQQE
jgi:hypothetical protein